MNSIYYPFQSEDFVFCDIFTCVEMASWICNPQGVQTQQIMLCDHHKQEREHREGEQVQLEADQVEANVRLALKDIDPNDARALWQRCDQILDDIHKDRF